MIDLDKPLGDTFPGNNFSGETLCRPMALTIEGVDEFVNDSGKSQPRLLFVETPTGLVLNRTKVKALIAALGDVPRKWVGRKVVIEPGPEVMVGGVAKKSIKLTIAKEVMVGGVAKKSTKLIIVKDQT